MGGQTDGWTEQTDREFKLLIADGMNDFKHLQEIMFLHLQETLSTVLRHVEMLALVTGYVTAKNEPIS